MTEDQLPKLDTGQIKQEIDRDGRERERKFKNNNHTNFVSIRLLDITCMFCCYYYFSMLFGKLWGE